MKKYIGLMLMATMLTMLFSGCSKQKEVVVYTAVEQVYCEPLFKQFEAETGIKVKAVYDTEANKTTGLVNRIINEADKPVCDVFWNNEFIQTIDLQQKGLLDSYVPAGTEDIPAAYKDADGYWTAFGGRARVMLVNTDLVAKENYPTTVYDFVNGKFEGKDLAMAYPMFGTTKTQAAAMYALLGAEGGKAFFQQIADRGVQIVDGNSVTKDMAAAGQVMVGYTDTDDAKDAIKDGAPVEIVYPDQEDGGIGTLITPSTAALIKNAPNKENAQKFIDFIVSKASEQKLIEGGFFDVSVRGGDGSFNVKGMTLNLKDIHQMLDVATKDMEEIFAAK
jgi:iron(III) transport system substrate-binding protein